MARQNPTIAVGANKPARPDGIELPYVSGMSEDAMNKGNEMPDVSMKPNDGDNPAAVQAPFANGKDQRVWTGGPSGADPTPDMPGA